jgi:hypothetical protein
MAWTDACKIEACAQVDNKKKGGIGATKAIRELSKESGIPIKTIERWYWPAKNNLKNEVKNKNPKKIKSQARVWETFARSLKRVVKSLRVDAKFPAQNTLPDDVLKEVFIQYDEVTSIVNQLKEQTKKDNQNEPNL